MAAHLVVPSFQQQQQQQQQQQHHLHHQLQLQHHQKREELDHLIEQKQKQNQQQRNAAWQHHQQHQQHQQHRHPAAQPSVIAPGAAAAGWPMAWKSHQAAAATTRAAAADHESWEVRAFAEDAASCSEQWPPRSYSCSFCAREFRTAQALGGHMNVHRRERAYANQLGLLRSGSSAANPAAASAATSGDSSSAAAAAAATAPALGLCWLYPVPAPSTNGAATIGHQVSTTSTVTTTSPQNSSASRFPQGDGRFGAFPPSPQCPISTIDRKKMLQDYDPNVDLELRLGQAL